MRFSLLLPIALLASACSTGRGGQTGEEAAHCVRQVDTALADDEKSPLGFGRAEVMATVDGPRDASLTWSEDATRTPVHFTFAPSADAAHYVVEEMRDDGSGQELSLGCTTYVEVKGNLTMKTDDGAFDETWSVDLRGQVAGSASTAVQIDWDALDGTYDFSRLIPEGETAISRGYGNFDFYARTTDDVSGEITGMSERQGPGDTVGASSIQVGTIGNDSGAP